MLWSVVLLALIATGITAAGRTDIHLASNLRAAARAEAAADGAIEEAAFHLLDPVTPWHADGQDRQLDVSGVWVTVSIVNEAGKANLNTASPELLSAILAGCGASAQQAAALAQAIVDWRFPGRATPGALSARLVAYRIAGLNYSPPGEPFERLEELGLVAGMTPDLLARLTPLLSIYNDSDVDPREADTIVRQAVSRIFGPVVQSDAPHAAPATVTITATAATAEGARFIRHATVRIGRSDREKLFSVLAWSGK